MAELEKLKKKRLQAMKVHDAARAIMANKPNEIQQRQFGMLTILELDTLLRWYNSLSGKMSKAEKVTRIKEIFENNRPPPLLETWREEDEERLQKLKDPVVELADTAVGRKQALMKQRMMAGGINLSEDEWIQLEETRKRKQGGNNG